MFDALIPYLTEHFSVLAPDNPGFGNSDGLRDISIASLSQCIAQVLADQGITRVNVFGHHTGAAIGAYLGAHYGDLCEAIAMCGPPALTYQQRKMLPAMAPVEMPEANGDHLNRMWTKLRSKETNAPAALSTRELGLAFSATATAATYQAVADYDFMADLSLIKCPLLLFAGDRDSLAGYLPCAAAAAPSAKIVTIDNAGGYICDLRPDLVAHLLSGFFLGDPAAALGIGEGAKRA